MGKRNNSYTASYKLKVTSFAEQFGNRAAQRDIVILESNVRYWRKQRELLKNSKSDSRAFRGPKAGKSAYFTHADFSAAKLEKKSAQIPRVNTVYNHSHHRGNVTAPYGRPNLRSRLHCGHNQEVGPRSLYGPVAFQSGRGALGGSNPPKFRSFAKAEPIYQFRGIYIINNLTEYWFHSFAN
jgi:hypothetical protein